MQDFCDEMLILLQDVDFWAKVFRKKMFVYSLKTNLTGILPVAAPY